MRWYLLDLTNMLFIATGTEVALEELKTVLSRDDDTEFVVSPTYVGCRFSSRAVGNKIRSKIS